MKRARASVVCGKKGVLGRRATCGLLMHYACVTPTLPGRPQPCPRCLEEFGEEGALQAWPHELEVGAKGSKRLRAPLVGVDGGQNAEIPFPAIGKPTDEQARRLRYADAEDWYCRSVRASLAGQPSAKADFKALPEVEPIEQKEMVDPGIKATILRADEKVREGMESVPSLSSAGR